MTSQEFADLLALGRERVGVEFKGPGLRTDKRLFEKVARAVLAMTNRRDGGVVIVGVDDERNEAVLTGLTPEQLASWEPDAVRDRLAGYADPAVDVEVEAVRHDGRDYVVITVREFADVPVICRRDGDCVREGGLYVRTRRKPESVEVPRQAEMRDLIDLATEKRLREFLRMAAAVGMPAPAAPAAPADEDRFARERAGFATDVVTKARSRGHWEVAIGPADYQARRLENVADLAPLVWRTRVATFGRGFPVASDDDERTRIGADWAEQDVDFGRHVGAWRLYQSGQFVATYGFWDDWFEAEGDGPWADGAPPPPGEALMLEPALWTLTEVFEFAARLALTDAGGETMQVRIAAKGLRGRALRFTSRDRAGFIVPPRATTDQYAPDALVIPRAELVAAPGERAAEFARELFRRFGWDPSLEMLHGLQQGRLRR